MTPATLPAEAKLVSEWTGPLLSLLEDHVAMTQRAVGLAIQNAILRGQVAAGAPAAPAAPAHVAVPSPAVEQRIADLQGALHDAIANRDDLGRKLAAANDRANRHEATATSVGAAEAELRAQLTTAQAGLTKLLTALEATTVQGALRRIMDLRGTPPASRPQVLGGAPPVSPTTKRPALKRKPEPNWPNPERAPRCNVCSVMMEAGNGQRCKVCKKAGRQAGEPACKTCAWAKRNEDCETGFECLASKAMDCLPASYGRWHVPGSPDGAA